MSSPQKSRLRIQKLTMQFWRERNAKLMLFRNDRNDTPHLLISWGNPSREIDIHLKSRSAGGQEDHHKIALLRERDFIRPLRSFKGMLTESIVADLHKIRKVKPGWLGHRGYAVFYMNEDEKSHIINRIAPLRKHHGKWERVPDLQALVEWVHSPEAMDNIYHHSILHDIAAEGYDGVIMAGRVRGKQKPKLIPLCLVKSPNGMTYWISLYGVSRSMLSASETLTLLCLKQLLPKDAWVTIFNALHLEEVGFELA